MKLSFCISLLVVIATVVVIVVAVVVAHNVRDLRHIDELLPRSLRVGFL